MDQRRRKILEAITEAFIKNALPIGSKHLCESYDFKVSSATIRNEMAALENDGYIMQPHTSAGRVPTYRAYRMLVDQLQEKEAIMRKAQKDMLRIRQQYQLNRTKQKLHETISVLAEATSNVCFATLPDKAHFFYMGISNILRKPEFLAAPEKTTKVVEILENDLANLLARIEVNQNGSIFIGEENILPEFQSCSLLAIPYEQEGFQGIIGILGPIRMNYAYNIAALKTSLKILND